MPKESRSMIRLPHWEQADQGMIKYWLMVRDKISKKHTYVLLYKQKVMFLQLGTLGQAKGNRSVPLPGPPFSCRKLDYQTSGLLLLTDDGELAYLLTHPVSVFGTYHALVEETISRCSGNVRRVCSFLKTSPK